jgi:hypothetical protein
MQTDPIGYGDGLNMYGYVGNDPTNLVDPLGLRLTKTCTGTRIKRDLDYDWNANGFAGTGAITGTDVLYIAGGFQHLGASPGAALGRAASNGQLFSATVIVNNNDFTPGHIVVGRHIVRLTRDSDAMKPTTFPTTPRDINEALVGPDDPVPPSNIRQRLRKFCLEDQVDQARDAARLTGAGNDLSEGGNDRNSRLRRSAGRAEVIRWLSREAVCSQNGLR